MGVNIDNQINNIKCIIFDCDGVLVDSEHISCHILLQMLKELGLEITTEQFIKEFNGRSLAENIRQIETIFGNPLPLSFENEFRQKTYEAFKTDLKPVKGILEFINSLTISYCVASSGPLEKIHLNLTTTGLIDKFQNRIFSSYQINSWKPEPGLFLYAAQKMGFSADECLVIEDSKAGVLAGVRGGFKVLGLSNNHNEKELYESGALIFHNFDEISRIIKIN